MIRKGIPFTIFIISWFFAGTYQSLAHDAQDCIRCHDRTNEKGSHLISVDDFENSVHGTSLTCTDCHTGITNDHPTKIGALRSVDCNMCHEKENRHGENGKLDSRPECHSCHGKHNILGRISDASSINSKNLKETCRRCHPKEAGLSSPFSWLPSISLSSHNKQNPSRQYKKDNCVGCHQGKAVHGEQGFITGEDCARCHIPLSEHESLLGYVHTDLEKQPVTLIAALIYAVFLLFLVLTGFRFGIISFGSRKHTG